MAAVLFIDDDASLLRVNRVYFEGRGFTVFTASCFVEAQKLLARHLVDCIVLDILMPETDGWDICRRLGRESMPPVIFLTSLTQQDCLYRGFELGASDYLTKPYELRELELRIKARISGYRGKQQERLEFSPLSIDAVGRQVSIAGKPVALTAYEFDILLLLARSPGTVFSLEDIYRQVWALPDLGNAQTVRTHLARMRHKLEEACPSHCFIDLKWGKGFVFRPDGQKKEEAR